MGHSMDWDKLKSFHAAAETGSLTAAGERLGISQSAVSRQIAALEESLKNSLFQRHARGLILTEAGRILHRATAEMASSARTAESALNDTGDTPHGQLHVTAPVAFGSFWLAPRIHKFADLYPRMRIKLSLDDREYDLLTLEAECAIRLWAADKADLIQRKLVTVRTSLYASEEYLEQHGTPERAEDLDRHRIVSFGEEAEQMSAMNWAQRIGRDDRPEREPTLQINNVNGMMRAVRAGLGIADLPEYMVSEEFGLRKVLPDQSGPTFDLFFIYPADLKRSRRISIFRDFITSELKADRQQVK
ncbi:LysR family transcriptional regulator [Hirschia maritima]|uniref:LysR family transcriptional regulator n=1 Tax=Hirschia maritima TaxID=1121961 RepID=UPI0003A45382|nr:LysR family transcriptional regulator [Hirschia maritima]